MRKCHNTIFWFYYEFNGNTITEYEVLHYNGPHRRHLLRPARFWKTLRVFYKFKKDSKIIYLCTCVIYPEFLLNQSLLASKINRFIFSANKWNSYHTNLIVVLGINKDLKYYLAVIRPTAPK